eukprot:4124602-Amphidinium_carterae.2
MRTKTSTNESLTPALSGLNKDSRVTRNLPVWNQVGNSRRKNAKHCNAQRSKSGRGISNALHKNE